ncbi:Gfo/Idh/MocA family oxidoreductase [Metabacillus sp. GX 13764]|uniref:Gfo/Idh/MocA family protein n=1 Tax=Metabacillus kandeliae TaxID=2900151 RepID=UPI001E4F0E3B|nr:Gfo/Idh/MocA family oxidoreductase [Metabacillus kandeliae]
MKVKTVVIGAGGIFPFHASAMKEAGGFELAAVCELHAEKRSAITLGVPLYSRFEEMLEAEKPDLCVICLPHHLHEPCAAACLQAGSHVLLEKPMAKTVQECDRLISLADSMGLHLFVAHTQKYRPEIKMARQLADSGKLGRLIGIQDKRSLPYFLNRPEWFFDQKKSGGGILMNLGGHSLERILYLSGTGVSILSSYLSFSVKEVEGSALLIMETDTGVPASVFLNGYAYEHEEETQLFFTEGSIRIVPGKFILIKSMEEEKQISFNEENHFIPLYQGMGTVFKKHDAPLTGKEGKEILQLIETSYKKAHFL